MKENPDLCTPRSRGSALVLVLLIIVLLTTLAVSFLSTARVEQIATGNFTRQTAARGLADLATAEAMAKIAEGFTATNASATTVTISQPGLIRSFEFTGSGNPTVRTNELFPTTNLVDGTNFNINTNGIITGNPAEPIRVPWQYIVDANGQTNGRITYYVDDEGTKLNLNQAAITRDTLNPSGRRPLDIAALAGADTDKFNSIIASTITNSTNIASWVHFFRPEQAVGAGVVAANQIPFVSAAVSTNTNSPNAKTAWGTDRLYINDSITLPVTDASVTNIYEALTGINPANGSLSTNAIGKTGQGLDRIFQGNFADKYTTNGVKQIAANILQMRDPNTGTVNASFTYNGSLLGGPNPTILNPPTPEIRVPNIPNEYLGYAPFPVITEVGVSVLIGGHATPTAPYNTLLIFFFPTIEISNPYPIDYNATAGGAEIIPGSLVNYPIARFFLIDEVSFDVEYENIIQRYTWTSSNRFNTTPPLPPNAQIGPNNLGPEQNTPDTFQIPNIPAFSKIQYQPDWNHWWSSGLPISFPSNSTPTIYNISNCTVKISEIKLSVNGNIRDWVTGNETGPINCKVTTMRPFPWNSANWPGRSSAFPSLNRGFVPNRAQNNIGNLPDTSSQRIDWIRKTPRNAMSNLITMNATGDPTLDDDIRNWTTTYSTGRGGGASGLPSTGFASSNWTESQSTWITPDSNTRLLQATETNQLLYNSSKANPSLLQNTNIPSDPALNDSSANAVYGNGTPDMRAPFLVTGNYTCPADLGLVPTNKRWRRLRMQVQPAAESAEGLIPDWAMLEVISFGPQAVGANVLDQFQPININGMFHVPQGTPPPAARDIGLKALAQVLNNNPNKLADPMSANGSTITIAEPTRFLGITQTGQNDAATVASNIGRMTWSAGSAWTNRRAALGFPTNAYLLPSEIMEIAGVADSVSATNYNNTSSHFKWNEGRISALLPGVSTKSSHFMIYACAQTLDKQGQVQSEALTKTLVEVEQDPTAPTTYKVKKLYTEPVQMD